MVLLESTAAIASECIATINRCDDGKAMVVPVFFRGPGSLAMRLCLPVCLAWSPTLQANQLYTLTTIDFTAIVSRGSRTMCQYRYDYYGYCQHQEFILVKLCENAVSLARVDKHHTEPKAEGAIVQAPVLDTTSASLCAAESSLCITEPSIVLRGEVDHSIYSLSTIVHIIVRSVAPCAAHFKIWH